MSGQLKIYNSDATPIELSEINLPTTEEGQQSAGTKFFAKNVGDASVLNSTFYTWPGTRWSNTSGSPLVSVESIVRDVSTKALQIYSIVDNILLANVTYTVYTSEYKCWYGGAAVTVKKNDVFQTTGFTLNYGTGQVTFSSPLIYSDVVKVSFSFKLSRPGTYLITFPSTSTCKVNGGSAMAIVADGVTENTNIISGLSIIFYACLTITDTATIIVSDGSEFVEIAPDSGGSPGTYVNTGQYNMGTITSGNSTAFWLRNNIPSDAGTAGNQRVFRSYLEGQIS